MTDETDTLAVASEPGKTALHVMVIGVFGSVTCVWFVCLGLIGPCNIFPCPAILWALNPWDAAGFFHRPRNRQSPGRGAVVLCVSGACGIAVTGSMTIDAMLFPIVAWRKWNPALSHGRT